MAYRPTGFIGLPFAIIVLVVLAIIIMGNLGYFPEGLW